MIARSLVRIAGALLAAGVLFGCSRDLDVTAPYKQITVVYALFDVTETTHFVKINKAYLGDGDAYVYAQIPDSTEYSDAQLQAHIEEWDGGTVVAQYALHDTIMPHDPGIFSGPTHKLYYFNAALNDDHTYKVVATANGNHVEAATPIVHDIIVTNPTNNTGSPLALRFGNGYTTTSLSWHTAANGRRYEVSYRFQYDEITSGGTTRKSFTAPVGTVVSDANEGSNASVGLNGELFFQTIGTRVPYSDPAQEAQVLQRVFQGVDLLWAVAGPDLHTYLELANPISGIVEERPDYTNVQGGYGLVSTRVFHLVGSDAPGDLHSTTPPLRKDMNNATLQELREGQYTGSLKFQ